MSDHVALSPEVISERAPAKINLALHVTGQRADGYHELESLVVFAQAGDVVEARAASSDAFEVRGPFAAQVPLDGFNLVLQARDALRAATDPSLARSVSIRLEKNLPVASGIGGGSSDAAAALRALARLWNVPRATEAVSLPLGADVPMSMDPRPLIACGVGERIEPLARFPELALVLINPGIAVSTPAVFCELQKRENPPLPPLPAGQSFGMLVDWLHMTRNDLEPPAIALVPAIADTKAALLAHGAAFARMSGSGATCFGLFPAASAATRAAEAISSAMLGWFVLATATTPAPSPS